MKIVPAIEVKALNYSYQNDGSITPVLKNLFMAILPGELVAIQGPSGSGKSTLLYLLGLLSAPTSGVIKVNGSDISGVNENELAVMRNRNIGFVFQQFHLLPKTSALENILLPTQYIQDRKPKSDCVKKAIDLATFVGLESRLQHYPNQLSGGQQQRVAICRALITNPDIILADEPTGNLDSKSAEQILSLLKNLNREFKKTVIIITHDDNVASECDRIIRIKDGAIIEGGTDSTAFDSSDVSPPKKVKETETFSWRQLLGSAKESFPSALRNLNRNRTRTALTMIGISVGIAAVLAMITLGQFTKDKILAGYADLGVNTIVFYGYPNWDQKATDVSPAVFKYFDWEQELVPLKKIFPEISRMSPILIGWNGAVNFGGRSIEQEVTLYGSSEEALPMANRKLLLGRNFSMAEIEQKSPVCIIGYQIAEQLFSSIHPIGQLLRLNLGENAFGCRVIGVMASNSSNKEYIKPNLQIYLPFTYYQAIAGEWWSSQIKEVMIQVKQGVDVEEIGNQIKAFFTQKYDKSGKFRMDANSVLVVQMRRFLALFTILLSSVAFVTLAVGGIGITNMMLVSVSERYREIGLRKALGATSNEIRTQFLVESVIVCAIAGLIGLILGFSAYHLAIWAATKFVSKLQFEWTFDWLALILSMTSIIIVGLLSGIFPAVKAEKLQVIDALRSE